MNTLDLKAGIKKAAELLAHSNHAVAFTGAGVSTPSGIPDFRSPDTGLWNKDDPFEVASLSAFRKNPERFFNWIQPLAIKADMAKPNRAHIGLAEMESARIIHSVITQNIDGLHQKAGSKTVLELHGSAKTATCTKCKSKYAEEYFRSSLVEKEIIPLCEKCGNILKPDVVLFGELLPEIIWQSARRECRKADVLLIIGSSLEVSPANSLPQLSLSQGAKLIIINYDPTHLDNHATVLLPIDVEIGISKIWGLIGTISG